jgi:hypothetical protein
VSEIFLSYRRDDSSGYSGRLYDRLRDHFGPNHVFRDVEALAPGVDFVAAIEEAVGSCDALIAVIGRRWLRATTTSGTSRLEEPSDFVRAEIGAALARNVPVFPILIEGAAMPSESDLPAPLGSLARRQALELSESRWDFDVARLIAAVEHALADEQSTPRDERREVGDQRDPVEVTPSGPTRVARAPVLEQRNRSASRIAVPIAVIAVLIAATGFFLLGPKDNHAAKVSSVGPPAATTTGSVPGEVLFRDDFSGRTGWNLNDDDRYASAYLDGAFRIYVKQTTRVAARAPLDAVPGGVRVAVDATKVSSGDGEFGLICRAGSALLPRYEARIDTNGDWRVAKVETASGAIDTLLAPRDRSEYTKAVHSTGVNRIAFACTGSQAAGAPVALTLTVNGQQVAVANDQHGLPPGQTGLTVQSSAPPMDVHFDNFVVERI